MKELDDLLALLAPALVALACATMVGGGQAEGRPAGWPGGRPEGRVVQRSAEQAVE